VPDAVQEAALGGERAAAGSHVVQLDSLAQALQAAVPVRREMRHQSSVGGLVPR